MTGIPKFRVYQSTMPDADQPIIEIDGKVKQGSIEATFDHHRSGERVNMDALPEEFSIENISGREIATHMLDTDYLISAVILRMGGLARFDDRTHC